MVGYVIGGVAVVLAIFMYRDWRRERRDALDMAQRLLELCRVANRRKGSCDACFEAWDLISLAGGGAFKRFASRVGMPLPVEVMEATHIDEAALQRGVEELRRGSQDGD